MYILIKKSSLLKDANHHLTRVATNLQYVKKKKRKEKENNSVSAKHNHWKTIKQDIPIFYVLLLSVLNFLSKYVQLNIPWFVYPAAMLEPKNCPLQHKEFRDIRD